ncbi:MAG: pirin family protein [Myxococcota bacterium]
MSALLSVRPLGFPWETVDPFLFCVHHDDAYPAGNEAMGPAASLEGRVIGQDFEGKDGWRMYHGEVVPGFPQHPHRGFETVTIVRKGFIDHSDSLGATARFGAGDVQWLTAGEGIVHSEMFPLRRRDAPNPVELFQIWLNLPAADKLVAPYFSMLWAERVPRVTLTDANGKNARVQLIAGKWDERRALAPPPNSWASRADADVAIWSLELEPGATLTLPPAADARTRRTLYVFRGGTVRIDGEPVGQQRAAAVRAEVPLRLEADDAGAEILVLQGRPIGEPVVQYGPFVMNSRAGIEQAFEDYRRTGFGGWPWKRDDPVHPREEGRFARHADGRVERPE